MRIAGAVLVCGVAGWVGTVPATFAGALEDTAQLPALQRSLRAREYHASPNSQGLQAPNRAQNFRTYFDATGIRIVDRTAPGSPLIARVTLDGVGRVPAGLEQAQVGSLPAALTAADARVRRDRPGLEEWFLNSENGLVHGLRAAARPSGEGPLRIRLALAGASATRSSDGVDILGGGRRLRLQRQPVTDARGTLLSSRLELRGPRRIELVIEDAAALYPISAELLFAGTAEHSIESNQLEAFLGWGVAAAGDVNGDGYGDIVLGAFRYDHGESDEGAAFVFHGGPTGVGDGDPLSADATLESNLSNTRLGLSVAGAGDVNGDGYDDIIVGALLWENDAVNQLDEGAALVFHGSATGVGDGNPTNADALLQGEQALAAFGYSVAGVGDVNGDGYADVVVGAPFYDLAQNDEGVGCLFLGGHNGIPDGSPASDTFTMFKNVGGANLGTSVAGAGDVNGDGYADIIIGAPYWEATMGILVDEGGAFIYLGDASPTGLITPATLRSNQDLAYAGWSVGGAGDVNGDGYSDVIVGMPNFDSPASDEGGAMIFHGSSVGITNGTPSTANTGLQSNQGGALLGTSVAMIGDTDGDGYADVAVGAPGYDGEGAVFVFLGHSGGIPAGRPGNAAVSLQVGQAGARFGGGVAGAGDVNGDGYADLVAGAPEWSNGHSDEGAAFVFHGGAAGVASAGSADAATSLQSTQAGDSLGFSVAGAGDVNGDGWGDVIVGASGWDDGEALEGAAFVFHGSASGIASGDLTTATTQLEGNQTNANFGSAVAAAGDVNGDGYGDVIVGARLYDSGEADEGAAFIFHGGASGVDDGNPGTAATTLESNLALGSLGASVAGVGDVNGDGYGDVALGAEFYGFGGLALVFHGGMDGVADGGPATAAAEIQSDQAGSYLGSDVAGAGDVNGDGYADLIVGARGYDGGQTEEGRAFIFHGGAAGIASGVPANATTVLEANQAGALFGVSVATAGDVDGDGYADVVVGASFFNGGQSLEGGAFIHMGGASGVSPLAAAVLESDQAGATFGASVSSAGDVNGDGFGDVVIGAPTYDDGEDAEGAVFVFHGSESGIANAGAANADTTLQGDLIGARFGTSVAGASEVNGDGFADVLVGAAGEDASAGGAYVFLGNGDGDGEPVRARQLRGGTPLPVQPWGSSAAEEFEIRLTQTHPAGRGLVRLEIEACPAALPFGDAGCARQTSAGWLNSNLIGPGLGVTPVRTFDGLAPAGLYRWRARTQYAPIHATHAGITPPRNPSHGPWRRYLGQAFEADLRTRPEGTAFYPLNPCRFVDTRSGSGAPVEGPSLTSGVERSILLRGPCGISPEATAVSVNVTVVSPTGLGSLVFYPNSGEVPTATHLQFNTGQTRANNAILGLDALGFVRVLATVGGGAGTVDLVVDINGEFR